MDFYPLDPNNPLSIRNLIEEIKKGKKVVVFPEGRITLTGKIMQVFDGAAMIASKAEAKLLPVKISGAQYSSLSYVNDKFYTRLFPKIDIDIMPARKFENFSSKNSRKDMAKKLYELMVEMSVNTAPVNQSLFDALVQSSKNNHKKHIVATDLLGNEISYKNLIKKAVAYGETLQQMTKDYQRIGICMPTGLNFLLWFWVVQYLGKTTVILSRDKLKEQIVRAKVDAVLVADFYDETSCEVINVSTIKPAMFSRKKVYKPSSVSVAMFKNECLLEYGSVDILKSYYMLDSVLPFNIKDVAVNTINSDVADGFVLGFILPILTGVKTCFIPNMNPKVVSRICYDLASTVILSEAKTYQECAKYASPFDYFNTKLAFSLGQKTDDEMLDFWLKNFNVRILESYIPDDSAIIATINTPLYYKFGSLGIKLLNNGNLDEIRFDKDGFAFK